MAFDKAIDKKKKQVFAAGVTEYTVDRPTLPFMDIRTFAANAAILPGQCLQYDFNTISAVIKSDHAISVLTQSVAVAKVLSYVIPTAATVAGAAGFAGVALGAASLSSSVDVIVGGFVPRVFITTASVTAGDVLIGGSITGSCEKVTTQHTNPAAWGFALSSESDDGNYVSAFMYPRSP